MYNVKQIRTMKKKAYETPQMEVMSMSVLSMMAVSVKSDTFTGGLTDPSANEGRANRRRNSWGNTKW